MTKDAFFDHACDQAEGGLRIKCQLPGEKNKNIWFGAGNLCGLHGEFREAEIGGKWRKSGARFMKKLRALVNTPGAKFQIQSGRSPDRLRMEYTTRFIWTSPAKK